MQWCCSLDCINVAAKEELGNYFIEIAEPLRNGGRNSLKTCGTTRYELATLDLLADLSELVRQREVYQVSRDPHGDAWQ